MKADAVCIASLSWSKDQDGERDANMSEVIMARSGIQIAMRIPAWMPVFRALGEVTCDWLKSQPELFWNAAVHATQQGGKDADDSVPL